MKHTVASQRTKWKEISWNNNLLCCSVHVAGLATIDTNFNKLWLLPLLLLKALEDPGGPTIIIVPWLFELTNQIAQLKVVIFHIHLLRGVYFLLEAKTLAKLASSCHSGETWPKNSQNGWSRYSLTSYIVSVVQTSASSLVSAVSALSY